MNGNNNQNSLIVNPLKTEKMVGSANVVIPNTVEHFGTHTQIAEDVQKIGMNWQRIRDFQDKTLGMNFLASIRDELSKFQVDLASKKETYQSDERINALKQKYQEKVEMYKKIASEQGYDSDYVDAYIARANQELQGAENNFLVKNLKYQEEVAIDNYNQGLLIQEQTNERYMVSRNYAQGISGFLETVGYLNDGVKSGYIDRAKVPIMIKQGWNGMLKAHGESLINTPNGASQIEQMLNWNFNQFASYFSKLDTKVGDNEFKLGSDEFEVWKSGLRSAYASLKSRQKAEKEMTLIERFKYERALDEHPIQTYLEEMDYPADYTLKEHDRINWNNLHYRKKFNSLDEQLKKGYPIIWEEKGLLENTAFFNSEAPAEQIIDSKVNLKYEVAGTSSKDVQDNYLDSTNRDSVMPTGSVFINLYQTNGEFAKTYDELFSPQNRAILEKTKKIIIPEHVFQSRKEEISILKENALNGDFKSQVLTEDWEKYERASVLIPILNEKGGVVNEKWAKKADIEKSWIEGKPFVEYSEDEQQELINVAIDELGDKKMWIGDYKLSSSQRIEKDLVTTGDDVFKNKVKVNFGDNGTVILPNNVNGQATVQATNNFLKKAIESKELIDPVTNKPIGSFSSLKVAAPLGETTLGVTYKGNGVLYKGKILKIPAITEVEK